jgi:hypothetical protein
VNQNPRPSELIIMISGVALFIFSFLTWIEISDRGESVGWNAWGGGDGADFFSYPGLFPIASISALLGLAAAVVIALRLFANVNLPERVVGFTWNQVHLVIAVFCALVTLSWVILDKSFGDDAGGADVGAGIGLWLSVIAAIGLVVGAVMLTKDDGAPAGNPNAGPPQSF